MRFFKTHQYHMLRMVAAWLEKKKSKLEPKVPVLKKLIPQYLELYGDIHALVAGKLKKTVVQTAQKRTARSGLITGVLKLVDVLSTWHSLHPGNSIPPEAQYNFTDLNRASVANLPKLCQSVINEAKKIPDIRDYGLLPGDITETEAYLEEYLALKSAPQQRKKEIATWNQSINDDIKECILFLEKTLDPMIRIATEGNKELRLGYFATRKVLTRGPGAISEKEAKYRKSRSRKKKAAKK